MSSLTTADSIKAAFRRWKEAGEQWIEATINLARQLYEARQQHASDQAFHKWLHEHGIKISGDDRAAFIRIAKNEQLARTIWNEMPTRSVNLIGKEIGIRFRNISKPIPENQNGDEKQDTDVTVFTRRICSRCNVREATVGMSMCSPCRPHKNSKGKKQAKSSREKPLGKRAMAQQIKEGSFAAKLLVELKRKRKEAHDVEITRRWRPEAISVIQLHNILDWIVGELESFVTNGATSLEDAANAQGGQNVRNHKDRIVSFDA